MITITPFTLASALLLISFTLPMSAVGGELLLDSESMTKECRRCHNQRSEIQQLRVYNPDTHHLLRNKEILLPTAPHSETDDDGLYDCLTCHTVASTPNGYFAIDPERDCFTCHGKNNNLSLSDRHHRLTTTKGYSCDYCHPLLPR